MIHVLLETDPRVAVFAVAIPSESKAGLRSRTFYDVALLSSGFWSCECFPFYRAHSCCHVLEARRVWAILTARRRR